MSITISRGLERIVLDACERAYPNEGCGLLIGPTPKNFETIGRTVLVEEARTLENSWDESSKTNRYSIDPRLIARVEQELSGTGRAIVGFFHSHPNAPAWPSPFDLMLAWPCLSYWIIRVDGGKISDSRSWQRTEDGRSFIEEEMIVEGL